MKRFAGIVFFIILAAGATRADSIKEVGRDRRFVACSNGVVADTRTGLE